MDSIKIGPDEKLLRDADGEWISREIKGRRMDGQNVCVLVPLHSGDVNLRLATPTCGGSRGSNREFNLQEKAILDLWARLGLNDVHFSIESVIAFVQHVMI